jgi:hypothetical protein
VVAESDVRDAEPRAPLHWTGRPAVRHAGAFLFFLLLSILLYGLHNLPDLGHRLVGGDSSDADFFVWTLRWWPYAIAHATNPFVSHVVWAPTGYNIAWTTSIPGPGLLLAPLTLAAGPVVAFNVLQLIAPALSAWTAYLLCHRMTGRAGPALAGGFVFGFSAFVANTMAAGHPNLALAFPLPLALYLVVLFVEGTLSRWRFVALLGLTLAGQFAIFPETFATGALMGTISGLAAFAFTRDDERRLVVRTAALTVAAFAMATVLVSPYLYAMLAYPKPIKKLGPLSDLAAHAETLAFPARLIAPGRVTAIGNTLFTNPTVQRNGMYIGLVLLGILGHLFVTRWRRPLVRVLAVVLAVSVALSMGTALEVGGRFVALPWRYVGSLPLLRRAVPSRLIVYAFLAAGVGLALWLAEPERRRARWVAGGIALLMIVPNPSPAIWSGTLGSPPFFATGQYRRYLTPGEVVLVLHGQRGSQMLWQAQADMGFTLAGGYLGGAPPDYADRRVEANLSAGKVGPSQATAVGRYLSEHGVGAIVLVGKPSDVGSKLAAVLGIAPLDVGGVTLFELPPHQTPG